MAGRAHTYQVSVRWTGNRGVGTTGYRAYGRDHEVTAPGKPPVPGSSDRAFHGDADRWNPEEMLVAALSQCHLLAYLHLAADNGVVVTAYTDDPTGTMRETAGGGGHFEQVTLRPVVTVAEPGMQALAQRLHEQAHELCFIAASVNFPVGVEPQAAVRPVPAVEVVHIP